ncbi:hypothetical protein D3C72_1051580 [compost metagenome]
MRKHGDEAGNVLDGELGKAKAAGKGKVTAGTIKGKALPAKVTQALVDGMDAFTDALEPEAHELMAGVRNGTEPEDVVVEVKASTLAALLACHQDVMDARAEQKRRAKEKAAKAAQAELA